MAFCRGRTQPSAVANAVASAVADVEFSLWAFCRRQTQPSAVANAAASAVADVEFSLWAFCRRRTQPSGVVNASAFAELSSRYVPAIIDKVPPNLRKLYFVKVLFLLTSIRLLQ